MCFLFCLKKDNFLRGDSSRKVQHQQQRKPRKKTKPPALTKKHKKKRRRGPRRPQKPIPPAVPQGNLSMPTSVSLPMEISHIRSVPNSISFSSLLAGAGNERLNESTFEASLNLSQTIGVSRSVLGTWQFFRASEKAHVSWHSAHFFTQTCKAQK